MFFSVIAVDSFSVSHEFLYLIVGDGFYLCCDLNIPSLLFPAYLSGFFCFHCDRQCHSETT